MEAVPPVTSSSRDLAGFLNRLEGELARIDRALFLAWWQQYDGTSTEGSGRWNLARTRLMGREELLTFFRAVQGRPHSAAVSRRIELARRITEDALVEQHPEVVRLRSRLLRHVFAYRPRWEGRRRSVAELREVVRTSPDRRRRRSAYLAYHRLDREVQSGLRELVRRRNERARVAGYSSFAEFRLAGEGLSLRGLERMLDAAERVGRPAVALIGEEFRERRDGGFFPWDEAFALEQRGHLPERLFPGRAMAGDALAAIRAWGFRGKRRPFRILQRSIPVGGMTLAVELPSDVRVVVNPKGGWVNYMILLHEFGHAVQDTYTRGATHLLRGPENIPGFAAFHEGIGATFEEVALDERWLATRKGLSRARAVEARQTLRDARRWGHALTAQWVRNELEMYVRPASDLARSFHRRRRAALGFDPHPADSFADPFWIEQGFYGKSYLIASMVSAQLLAAIRLEVGGSTWPNRAVIPWLADRWFRHGMRYDWVPRMTEVTGRPLGPRDFLESDAGAVA